MWWTNAFALKLERLRWDNACMKKSIHVRKRITGLEQPVDIGNSAPNSIFSDSVDPQLSLSPQFFNQVLRTCDL
ncbi:unnamed protein product [Leptidea sinapis]|uniref:Uncharacterized protein n=1 Tax=Leptidea sinapis TaxID=189913 RepID=A0A5E4R406_9NEOP|nr:unnamed protein product [Leptidea sinapis]